MGFILGLMAMASGFAVWHFLYNDAPYDSYLRSLGKYGAQWKKAFWVSVGFAAFSMLIFMPAPAYVAMLIHLVFGILWLASPAGQKLIKDKF